MAKRKTTEPIELGYIAEALRPLAVPIGELVEDPRNARKHSEANLGAIAASLERFGMVKPVVVNRRNNQVVAGNGAVMAARRLGWSHVALADNRTAELAEWDDLMLAELMAEVQRDSEDLYDALLLAELGPEVAAADETASGGGKSKRSLTLRMPAERYEGLAAEAKGMGMNISQLCLAKLAKPWP